MPLHIAVVDPAGAPQLLVRAPGAVGGRGGAGCGPLEGGEAPWWEVVRCEHTQNIASQLLSWLHQRGGMGEGAGMHQYRRQQAVR